MGRYAIDRDFALLSILRSVVWPWFLPVANAFLGAFAPRAGKRRIESYDGGTVGFWLLEPADLPPQAPCLVYFHGGGFMYKACVHHTVMARRYADQARCKVVMVDYRLAPKHPFPAAVEDALAAYGWVQEHAAALGVDPARVAVGGDSAGGNLAAACCLLARDRGLAPPCLQLLIYPVIDRRMTTPSMAAFTDTPMWNAKSNRTMWRLYLPPQPDLPVCYASPLEAESLAGLPDAYVETAEFDCLRDEAIAYAGALEGAGCAVELHETRGTVHGFDAIHKSAITRQCVAWRVAALQRAFARPSDGDT